MKSLIYELFSGVGFCNQLFSLETAIYLANITDRKLILLIRYPLCHVGSSSWEYGKFLDFFSNDYLKFLPNGVETYYGNVPIYISNIIKDGSICETLYFQNIFSQVGIVDKELDIEDNRDKINEFLNHRKKCVIDFGSYTKDYIYINKSNAARCFYNFYTTQYNYRTMSLICESLTHLQPSFYHVFNKLELPKNYIAIHFRFGDRKHTKREVDRNSGRFCEPLCKLIGRLNLENLPIVIMCDRQDAELLHRLKSNYQIIYTTDLIKDLKLKENFEDFTRTELIDFLIQKTICDKSDIFIGHDGSTVSNYINYMQYLNNKPYYYYLDKVLKYNYVNYSWKLNGFVGGNISFRVFFADNIVRNDSVLITLTNDGYMDLTENLLISLKRLGIEHKLKIYCIGEKAYDFFEGKYTHNDVVQIDISEDYLKNWVEYKSAQNPDVEGKKKWATLTSYKMYAINTELNQNNDVIFTDGDIVFEKDPISYLTDNIKSNDLLIQNDNSSYEKRCMCTGLFYMKSNELTKEITNFDIISENIASFTNDQQYLRRFEHKMKVEYLDLNLFPNGLYYRQNKPTSPYLIHFNYDVSEHKIKRMKTFNKWYLDEVTEITPPKLTSTSSAIRRSTSVSPLRQIEVDRVDLPLTKYIEAAGHKIRQGYITQVKKHEEMFLFNIDKTVHNVLEIGFLAGHSAEMFLKMNSYVNVTSVELGAFQSVACGKKYIDKNYPKRHTLLKGDSNEIIPIFVENTNIKFDIILIDGSYEEKMVRADIMNCRDLAHENTLLIINNVLMNGRWVKYWNQSPTSVSKELIASKVLTCKKYMDIDVGRGTLFCTY
tara:strand:+ start:416 stop:2896 length:2481 start_codon:yes stop_codon:yes gene_type:complete